MYGKDILVGGFLPRPLADEFSLYVYYMDSTKSAMIREMVQDLLRQNNFDSSELISKIAADLYKTWDYVGEQNLENYITDAKRDMTKRGVAPFFADRIVEEVRKLYAENKENNEENQ